MKSKYNIQIIETPFNPWKILLDYEINHMQNKTNYGATATFVGTMRDFNEGDKVTSMILEHYSIMTKKRLASIVSTAIKKWQIQNVLLIHRVGKILPAEPIVLVATWSIHRAAAFDACRMMIENLKHQAPFWKKETLLNGDRRWVETNT